MKNAARRPPAGCNSSQFTDYNDIARTALIEVKILRHAHACRGHCALGNAFCFRRRTPDDRPARAEVNLAAPAPHATDKNADVLWVGNSWGTSFARIDTRTSQTSIVPFPDPAYQPYHIAVDTNHNAWAARTQGSGQMG
jgi:hypothetical protein